MVTKIENDSLRKIATHVTVLNEEVGLLKNDVKWIRKIMYYMAGIISVGVGKILFFG